MAQSLSLVSDLTVEDVHFPSSVVPPGSSNSLFLGGAGVRELEIDGRFVKFTSIGVYLEESAIQSLAATWKGKAADELFASGDFFIDVVKGPFEKFTRVSMILPLTGQQYSNKVAENCEKYWKAIGIYTEEEAAAIKKFKAAFKDQTFPPGAAILFTQSPSSTLTIAFSKDGSIPDSSNAVIENKALSEAVLESIIGQHGVSPAAKKSLASRVSDLSKELDSQKAQV